MARPRTDQVPAAPFAQWLNERLAHHTKRCGGDLNSATVALTFECGWSTQKDGARKLFRYRKQMRSTSFGKADRKGEVKSDTFPRQCVEEALHHAGLRLGDLYPYEALVDEFQMEYEVPRDQARVLADAWIERTWHTAWQDVGRFTLPEYRPRRYCAACKRTTRVFAGCCEECMAPDRARILAAVA